ncbi:MAG: sigma-70 family RNA polymerase sigma factor [Cyanobacteriota bacterium]|nr:sigma-70 family RNA polymerase sigma factor [Cyanobacteriota bacterium]
MSTNRSIGPCGGRPRPPLSPPRPRSSAPPPRRAARPGRPPRHDQRNALVREHLPLADRIAANFHRRYGDLVELDDLRQEARLELVRSAARAEGPSPEPYLQRCIAGALRHHIRDRALLVRLPAKRRDAAPWKHVSLDVVASGEETPRVELLVAPAIPEEVKDAPCPALEALLAGLPEPQAQALRLTVLEGWSLRLAAQHLGVTPPTVKRAQLLGLEGVRQGLAPHTHHTTPAPLAACSSHARRSAALRTTSRQRAEGAAERSSTQIRTQR